MRSDHRATGAASSAGGPQVDGLGRGEGVLGGDDAAAGGCCSRGLREAVLLLLLAVRGADGRDALEYPLLCGLVALDAGAACTGRRGKH